MSAMVATDSSGSESSWDATDLIPFSVGGSMLGAAVAVFSFCISGAILIAAQSISGVKEHSVSWPAWAVVAIGVVAIIVSVLVGLWLYSLRRGIGLNCDPSERAVATRKRRHFAVGSLAMYCVLQPFIWVVMVAVAYTS